MSVANDIASVLLDFYVKERVKDQNIQDMPLLAALQGKQKTFPGGKEHISTAVRGTFMTSTAGFFAGYSEDEQLVFKQSENVLRAEYDWYEVHAGLWITWTELKKDGLTIRQGVKTSEHSRAEVVRLVEVLEERNRDFMTSWDQSMNTMLWKDGAQDSQQVPGMKALITTTPAVGTTGGLNRATYSWWRHRQSTNIASNPDLQTLIKTMRKEAIQLRRYGGRNHKILCGSDFWNALSDELTEKGSYSQTGWAKDGNDVGVGTITLKGLGTFEYDPNLDDLGESKFCYIFDQNALKLRPMDGEANKLMSPERPYDYFVFIKSMTWTGGCECTQLNACGQYSIA